jgi:hypothetical protein
MLSDPRGIYEPSEDMHVDRIVLDRSVGYGASRQSMRYNYPSGTTRDYTISRSLSLRNLVAGSGVTEVWVEVKVRWSPDFTINGVGQPWGGGYKVLHVNQWGTSGRFGYSFHQHDDYKMLGGGVGGIPYISGPSPSPRQMFNGEWHTIRVHIDISGTPHFHEFWINGVYQGNSSIADTGANSLWSVSLNKNLNKLSDREMEAWWGQVKIWFSDPGW